MRHGLAKLRPGCGLSCGGEETIPMPLPPAVTIPTFIDCLLRSFHAQSSTQPGAPRNDWNWLADLCNVNSYRFGRLVMLSASYSESRGRLRGVLRGHLKWWHDCVAAYSPEASWPSMPFFIRCQSKGVSDSRPNSTRPVEYMTRGCTPMCCVMICTSRNARSSGQLT